MNGIRIAAAAKPGNGWKRMDETIEVIINDFKEIVLKKTTLAQLIEMFEEKDAALIVEVNGRFIYPRKYGVTVVTAGDRIEFINPNFGG